MKLLSWNVNGLRAVYKKEFIAWLAQEQPDVLCLQEIKAQEEDLVEELLAPLGYRAHFNCAQKRGYSGVAVYSRMGSQLVSCTLGYERFDSEGRMLVVQEGEYVIVNLYMPHGGREKENLAYKLEVYQKLREYLKQLPLKRVILMGDFNIARDERDLARPKQNKDNIMFTPQERAELEQLLSLGFLDSFRVFEADGGHYSWWPYRVGAREKNIGWRIDYILVSTELKTKLQRAFISPEVTMSDHCPIGIVL